MSNGISLDEAQANLREIVLRLGSDEEVVITENDQPVAKLVRCLPRVLGREPGFAKGMITIIEDDDEQLDDNMAIRSGRPTT